jgi:hypothetical protein
MIYIALILGAIQTCKEKKARLYLALDTTMLWNEYCFVYLAVVCGGRAVPLMLSLFPVLLLAKPVMITISKLPFL